MRDEGFYARLKRTPTGCLVWTGTSDKKGYGRITRRGLQRTPILVHRLAYFYATGEWPPVVMHRCDNPPCCEPTHLAAGTVPLNNADMRAKGRGANPPNIGWMKWCSTHPRTPENMKPNGWKPNGERVWTCRECNRARQRRVKRPRYGARH